VPTEVWVAIFGLGGPILVAIGYFLRPLGDFFGEVVRERRDERRRRSRFQFETLVALADELQADRATFRDPEATRIHRAKWESMAFRVNDDELRRLLEELLVAQGGAQSDVYGNVLRRLGHVLREM
jgi:hypothetical protein